MSNEAVSPRSRSWTVAFLGPIPPLDFAAVHGFSGPTPVGFRVAVWLQGRVQIGLVIAEGTSLISRLEEAIALIDEQPWISEKTVQALQICAKASHAPLGLLLNDTLGADMGAGFLHEIRPVEGASLAAWDINLQEDWQNAEGLNEMTLAEIRQQGLLHERIQEMLPTDTVYKATNGDETTLTLKQLQAWEVLKKDGPFSTLISWSDTAGVGVSVVKKVMENGLAALEKVPRPVPELRPSPPPKVPQGTLKDDETLRIDGGKWADRCRVLSAYILRALQEEKSVMVLAPDQKTLSEAWESLSGVASLAEKEALLLSGKQSLHERHLMWNNARKNGPALLFSTRIGFAAPLQDLGLIVLLEEGHNGHKSLGGSRFWTPFAAQHLAETHSAQLIFASGVSAVEQLHLPAHELPPPRVRLHIIDLNKPEKIEFGPMAMSEHQSKGMGFPLSNELIFLLHQTLDKGRQAVLFSSRRGFSALLLCRNCKSSPCCPHCDVPLRVHQGGERLRCNQCGFSQPVMRHCPNCRMAMLQSRGPGSEWIAERVRQALPSAAVFRVDGDHQDDLGEVYAGKSAVVVGTHKLLQEAAPPDLALIGVTLADTMFSVPDFRASEHYHQTLWRLAAWHPSRAPLLAVQTFTPDHPALLALENKRVSNYPRQLLEERELSGYPPFGHLCSIAINHSKAERAEALANEAAEILAECGATENEIWGPTPAPIPRIKGKFIWLVLLRTASAERQQQILSKLPARALRNWRLDINPRDWLGEFE